MVHAGGVAGGDLGLLVENRRPTAPRRRCNIASFFDWTHQHHALKSSDAKSIGRPSPVQLFNDARHRTGCPDGTPFATRCLSFSKWSFVSYCFRRSDRLPESGRGQAAAPRNQILWVAVPSIAPVAAGR